MRTSTQLFLTACISFITATTTAQPSIAYSNVSFIVRSDSTARSVLLSNLMENKNGSESPIIGSANWSDSGKYLQCRSLLAFDYGMLTTIIDPEHIVKAELVLNPLRPINEPENDKSKTSKLVVRRVLQPWEDSLTNWANQPPADTRHESSRLVSNKKKETAVRINVTELVRDMFKYGNNGFLLSSKDLAANPYSQWFASVKNEDKDLRPVLLISISVPYSVMRDAGIPPLPLTTEDKAELLRMYTRPEPVTTTPPTPPKEPIKE
ncbi:MAG: DNRLRE domain-containing protein [Chitinophagaceae bacterium]